MTAISAWLLAVTGMTQSDQGGALGAATDRYQTSIGPGDVEALHRARELRRARRGQPAIASLEQIVRRRPDYFLAQYNLGLAYLATGDLTKGAEALRLAREVRDSEQIPEYTIDNTLGWALMLAGKLDEAEESLKFATLSEDKLSRVSNQKLFNNLGTLYLRLGKFEEARLNFSKAAREYGSRQAETNLRVTEAMERAVLARGEPPSDAAAK